MKLFFIKVTGRGIRGTCEYVAFNAKTCLTMLHALTFADQKSAEAEALRYRKLGYVQQFEVVEL